MRRPIASLFMRGVMFNPNTGTQQVIDTDEMDCTTPNGRSRIQAIERLLFRRSRESA